MVDRTRRTEGDKVAVRRLHEIGMKHHEIAERTKLPIGTVHRFVREHQQAGRLDQRKPRSYPIIPGKGP